MWKKCVGALKPLYHAVRLDWLEAGLELSGMSPCHVSLAWLHFPAQGFAAYRLPRARSFTLSTFALAKLFKKVRDNDEVTIRWAGGDVTFLFRDRSRARARDRLCSLPVLGAEVEYLPIPEAAVDSLGCCALPSGQFKKICEDLERFGDSVTIATTRQAIQFIVEGDIGTGTVSVHQPVTLRGEPVRTGPFAARYLRHFTEMPPADTVFIRMGEGRPIAVEYAVRPATLRFFLAPKIEEDGTPHRPLPAPALREGRAVLAEARLAHASAWKKGFAALQPMLREVGLCWHGTGLELTGMDPNHSAFGVLRFPQEGFEVYQCRARLPTLGLATDSLGLVLQEGRDDDELTIQHVKLDGKDYATFVFRSRTDDWAFDLRALDCEALKLRSPTGWDVTGCARLPSAQFQKVCEDLMDFGGCRDRNRWESIRLVRCTVTITAQAIGFTMKDDNDSTLNLRITPRDRAKRSVTLRGGGDVAATVAVGYLRLFAQAPPADTVFIRMSEGTPAVVEYPVGAGTLRFFVVPLVEDTDGAPPPKRPRAEADLVERLERDRDAALDRLRCAVCWDQDRSVLLQPCLHLVACEACARGLALCPVCRTAVARRIPGVRVP